MNLPPVAILAGGLATRLYPITQQIPKSLIDVAGKPFVVRQLELLSQKGVDRVVMCIGNLGEQITALLGNGAAYNMDIQYSFDGSVLLGTGGALKQALPLLGDSFFVMYGDSYLDCDFRTIYDEFLYSKQPALMTVYHNDNQWDSSNVVFREGKIVRYDKHKRSVEMEHIDYGLGIFRHNVFDLIEEQAFDLANIYRHLADIEKLAGFEVFNRFYEIGSHTGLLEAQAYFASK